MHTDRASPETEAYTINLASQIQPHFRKPSTPDPSLPSSLRILDLCSGTGCIPLLFHSRLYSKIPNLTALGVDISLAAISLARRNLQHNLARRNLPAGARHRTDFLRADILAQRDGSTAFDRILGQEWDIVTSNPPYISTHGFRHETARSVRNWEPRTALVPRKSSAAVEGPGVGADVFYPRLLEIAATVGAKVVLLEVADMHQAIRVVGMAVTSADWKGVEILRDWPDEGSTASEVANASTAVEVDGRRITIRGRGNGRAVLCWNAAGRSLLGRLPTHDI